MLVHFPIALLFVGVLFELIGHLRGREDFQKAGLYTLVAGFAGLVLAVVSGKIGEEAVEGFLLRRPGAERLLEGHETAAFVTLAVFAALLLWRTLGRKTLRGPAAVAYLLLAAVGLGTLGYTGFLGGELAHPSRREAAGAAAPERGAGQWPGGATFDGDGD